MLCNEITMVNCNKYSCFSAIGACFLFRSNLFIDFLRRKQKKTVWRKINKYKFNSFALNWWALGLPLRCCWDFSRLEAGNKSDFADGAVDFIIASGHDDLLKQLSLLCKWKLILIREYVCIKLSLNIRVSARAEEVSANIAVDGILWTRKYLLRLSTLAMKSYENLNIRNFHLKARP